MSPVKGFSVCPPNALKRMDVSVSEQVENPQEQLFDAFTGIWDFHKMSVSVHIFCVMFYVFM